MPRSFHVSEFFYEISKKYMSLHPLDMENNKNKNITDGLTEKKNYCKNIKTINGSAVQNEMQLETIEKKR